MTPQILPVPRPSTVEGLYLGTATPWESVLSEEIRAYDLYPEGVRAWSCTSCTARHLTERRRQFPEREVAMKEGGWVRFWAVRAPSRRKKDDLKRWSSRQNSFPRLLKGLVVPPLPLTEKAAAWAPPQFTHLATHRKERPFFALAQSWQKRVNRSSPDDASLSCSGAAGSDSSARANTYRIEIKWPLKGRSGKKDPYLIFCYLWKAEAESEYQSPNFKTRVRHTPFKWGSEVCSGGRAPHTYARPKPITYWQYRSSGIYADYPGHLIKNGFGAPSPTWRPTAPFERGWGAAQLAVENREEVWRKVRRHTTNRRNTPFRHRHQSIWNQKRSAIPLFDYHLLDIIYILCRY